MKNFFNAYFLVDTFCSVEDNTGAIFTTTRIGEKNQTKTSENGTAGNTVTQLSMLNVYDTIPRVGRINKCI